MGHRGRAGHELPATAGRDMSRPASESGDGPLGAPDLAGRLALRPREAAAALGVSERKLRELLPELPHVRVGGVVLLPVEGLRAWLSEQAVVEQGRAEKVAEEILEAIAGSGSD